VNVVETEDALWVLVAVPGVRGEDIQVRLADDYLMITGERPLPECCADGELKIWEIPFGRFERHVGPLDPGYALAVEQAAVKDGLLLIQLRKTL
jgi:HSP20 family molecular chaperone IbpA